MNAITAIDGYKVGHKDQYVPGITRVNTNQTPRSVKYLPKIAGTDDKIVVLGHTYFVKWYLVDLMNRTFFSVPREVAVKRYQRLMDSYLGKGAVNTDHIGALHDLGFVPVSIRALDEGTVINAGVPFMTLENTLPEFFWITNYLETIASNLTWMMTNNATIARKYKTLMLNYAKATGGDVNFVPFQGHDFSFRGMSSPQSAEMSGLAHLTSFVGTDTIPALEFAETYYGADLEKELVGASVAATEHSVMCSYGKTSEFDCFKHLITKVYPNGIVSIVADTFDFWGVLTDFLPRLKDVILARKGGPIGDKVVIRPDSGDPVKIVVGDPDAPEGSPENLGAIQCLWNVFGGTINEKGFKVLDPHIGLIYGDSITLQRCKDILEGLKAKGFASTNIVFGVGSYTYQYQTRDTLSQAFKATSITVDGVDQAIFKEPKTDGGTKKSAKGNLVVLKNADGEYVLVDGVSRETALTGELKEVFRDGKILRESTLAQIRARVNDSIVK